MNVTLDLNDPTPPYEQIRRQIAAAIELGTLSAGIRLPPVRQLAADLGVATGTVARAYAELDAAGVIHTRRGGGTRVADATAGSSSRGQDLERAARTYAHAAAELGVDLRGAAAALHQVWPG